MSEFTGRAVMTDVQVPDTISAEGELLPPARASSKPANDSLSAFEQAAGKHTGQGTQVEQARAVAEVRAAVLIAMERPRDAQAAIKEMRTVCRIQGLADRAFFSVPRGKQTVNGESIHLARELARCWGNITYGVKELVRDDVRKQSEILAYAWDMQTNARSELVFVIPHQRQIGKSSYALTGTQEIYENNASFAGRRLRECIFAVLPVWFKTEASEICRYTLEHGSEKPLTQRRADCQAVFEKMGITAKMLEKRVGRSANEWLVEDLANLGILAKSIQRNEVTREEAFPDEDAPVKPLPANADKFEIAAAGHIAPTDTPTPTVTDPPSATPAPGLFETAAPKAARPRAKADEQDGAYQAAQKIIKALDGAETADGVQEIINARVVIDDRAALAKLRPELATAITEALDRAAARTAGAGR